MNRRNKNRVVVGLIGLGMLVAIGTAVIPPFLEVSATDAGKFIPSFDKLSYKCVNVILKNPLSLNSLIPRNTKKTDT